MKYHLKSCPRCKGDMRQYLEPQDGKQYVQCLMCGCERALEPVTEAISRKTKEGEK